MILEMYGMMIVYELKKQQVFPESILLLITSQTSFLFLITMFLSLHNNFSSAWITKHQTGE